MRMPDIINVLIASAVAFGTSFGMLVIARRAGLSDVDKVLNTHREVLVTTLTKRVEHLESENQRLTNENDYLKRELDQLRAEVQRLERYIIKHKIGDNDAG